MSPTPFKPRRLYEFKTETGIIRADPFAGIYIRETPILNTFLEHQLTHSTTELNQLLVEKYGEEHVLAFLPKAEALLRRLNTPALPKPLPGNGSLRPAERVGTLSLNLTHACNLRCEYCFESQSFRGKSNFMSREVAIQAVTRFAAQLENRSGTIIFTGGEPILNLSTLRAVVKLVKERRLPIDFLIKTNATLFTEEMVKEFIAANIHVQISIDGREETHDKHRKTAQGKGSFHDVLKAIKMFARHNYGHQVTFNATVTKATAHHLEQSLTFLKNLLPGAAHIVHAVMDEQDGEYRLTPEQALKYFQLFYESYINKNSDKRDANVAIDQCGQKCRIGLSHIAVDTTGDVYPCYRLSGQLEFKMGVVSDAYEILTMPPSLQKHYQHEYSIECGGCYAKTFCYSGCTVEKLHQRKKCCSLEKQCGDHILATMMQKFFGNNDCYVDQKPSS